MTMDFHHTSARALNQRPHAGQVRVQLPLLGFRQRQG